MLCAQVITHPIQFPALNINQPGREHTVEVGGINVQPSHCTLPIFHAVTDDANVPAGIGDVSNDGHHFGCNNPIVQQTFHV